MHILASSLISVKGEIMEIKKEYTLVHHKHKKLFLCEKCLCWSGEIYVKQTSVEQKSKWMPITCLCNGIKCEACGYKRVKPCSCVWSLLDDRYSHVPYFAGIRPCEECGGKMVKD